MNYDENLTITSPLQIAYDEQECGQTRVITEWERETTEYLAQAQREGNAWYFLTFGTYQRQW